jgi:putative sigma-54 modulation protein
MDASPAIQQYASDKLQHVVSKYVHGEDIDSQITFSVEKFWHIVNFTININGLTVKSVEKTEDMYSSIDLALEKVERQMRRYKSKIRSHRPDKRQRNFRMQVVAPAETEVQVTTRAEGLADPPIQTLKAETHTAPFMKLDDAIMQLELRGAQFFVFTNEGSERINIVHRRDDGNFGLIEAEPQHH